MRFLTLCIDYVYLLQLSFKCAQRTLELNLLDEPKSQYENEQFFAVVLSKMNLGSFYVENVSFCLNNPEICDKTYQ